MECVACGKVRTELVTERRSFADDRGKNAYLILGVYWQKSSCHCSVILQVLTIYLSPLSAKCAEHVSTITTAVQPSKYV